MHMSRMKCKLNRNVCNIQVSDYMTDEYASAHCQQTKHSKAAIKQQLQQ